MTLYFVQMPEDRRIVFERLTSKKLSGPGCSKHYSLNNVCQGFFGSSRTHKSNMLFFVFAEIISGEFSSHFFNKKYKTRKLCPLMPHAAPVTGQYTSLEHLLSRNVIHETVAVNNTLYIL